MARYGVNKAILVGNLGKDPEVRHLDSGVAVANFSMATSERFKTRDGVVQDRTQWHNIVMWRGLAETAGKYLKKGSTIYVEGKIINRSWESDGVTKYRTEIEVDNMIMLDSRPVDAGASSNFPSQGKNTASSHAVNPDQQSAVEKPSIDTAVDEGADDLPF